MLINHKSVLSLLLATLTLFTTQSYANKVYTIGVQNFKDYSPYSSVKNNQYQGFNRELLDMFASSQNFTFDYKTRPIKRLYSEFLKEKLDFKYPDNINWAPEKKQQAAIHYSDAVVQYIDGLIIRKENKNKTFSQLKKIGVMSGFTPDQRYLDAQQKGELEFIYVNNYERLFKLVNEQRIDGAYFDIIISQHHILHSASQKQHLVFNEKHPFRHGTRSLSSIKHPEMIEQFNLFLIEHATQINALKLRYNISERKVIASR
ncbi:hypothetical protein CW745_11425 [Psychromonas sp. psych-6C06]|uniref:substrate-binding periplasmic protein n=1 Tax=Psychromonas sp. psych-6C06 TaxID=2058089 RepID=UPI000C3305AE|nr:transporter substrate-binding domain-containing protein [Psychromonas sp. psych-6C06]PKF61236.1 hypothetical protein CW745_11425 [Psychromonas sp. psych-6C06]